MYILIVEDQENQYEFIEKSIKEEGAFRELSISRIVTEYDFRENFERIASLKPDVIVMDVMLRWTDPMRSMPIPPQEVKEQGKFRAGIRCIRMLASDHRTRDIPLIIYSILEKEDLISDIKEFSHARYVLKDFSASRLVSAIRSLVR